MELEQRQIDQERDAEIRRAKMESDRGAKAIENRMWLWAVLIPPLPAILVGLIVVSMRLANERKNISSDRLV